MTSLLNLFFLLSPLLQGGGAFKPFPQLEKVVRDGHFAVALEMLRESAGEKGTKSEEIAAARDRIFEEARKKLQEILANGAKLEGRGKLSEALSYYEQFTIDFPLHRDFSELGEKVELLKGKISTSPSASGKKDPRAGSRYAFLETTSAEIMGLVELGKSLEKNWKFGEAQKKYAEALKLAQDAVAKHLLSGFLEDAQRKIWFLDALADALTEDPSRFQDLEWGSLGRGDLRRANPEGWMIFRDGKEENYSWTDFPLPALSRLLTRFPFEAPELCNAAVLLYGLGMSAEADQILWQLLQKDPSQKPVADSILARQKGEEVTSYGYVWFKDRWMSFREREEFKFAEEIDRQIALLDNPDEEQRKKALEALMPYASSARTPLLSSLESRRELLLEKMKASGTPKKIGRIRALRQELDKRRKFALELIFDEEKYFYPYHPPECPPEKAKLYAAVQTEVDARVAAVREIWNSPESLALSGPVRAQIRDLQMLQDFLQNLGAKSPASEWKTLFALDPEEETLDVRSFFWDRKERREAQEYNRRVLAFNALVESSCSEEEKKQIFLTNDYRILMGRKALAINEKLQKAARGHSKEMSDLGYFSHFSPTPELKTPFDRMKREGYSTGAGENIASGASGAEGAHDGWIHSSGHHRNILNPFHREMGSGNFGSLWTQNFGSAKEYEENPAWLRN